MPDTTENAATGGEEAAARTLTGFPWLLQAVFSLVLVGFYTFSAIAWPAPPQFHRGVYVLITLCLIYMLYPARSGRAAGNPGPVSYLLMAGSIACTGYWMSEFEHLNLRAGAETRTDFMISLASGTEPSTIAHSSMT